MISIHTEQNSLYLGSWHLSTQLVNPRRTLSFGDLIISLNQPMPHSFLFMFNSPALQQLASKSRWPITGLEGPRLNILEREFRPNWFVDMWCNRQVHTNKMTTPCSRCFKRYRTRASRRYHCTHCDYFQIGGFCVVWKGLVRVLRCFCHGWGYLLWSRNSVWVNDGFVWSIHRWKTWSTT